MEPRRFLVECEAASGVYRRSAICLSLWTQTAHGCAQVHAMDVACAEVGFCAPAAVLLHAPVRQRLPCIRGTAYAARCLAGDTACMYEQRRCIAAPRAAALGALCVAEGDTQTTEGDSPAGKLHTPLVVLRILCRLLLLENMLVDSSARTLRQIQRSHTATNHVPRGRNFYSSK